MSPAAKELLHTHSSLVVISCTVTAKAYAFSFILFLVYVLPNLPEALSLGLSLHNLSGSHIYRNVNNKKNNNKKKQNI